MKVLNLEETDQTSGGFYIAGVGQCALGAVTGVVAYTQSAKDNSNLAGASISALAGCAAGVFSGIPGYGTAALTSTILGAVFAEKVSTPKQDTSYWSDFNCDFDFSTF